MNDYVDPVQQQLSLAAFEEAVDFVRKCGPSARLSKWDAKAAFRTIFKLHSSQVPMAGFSFRGKTYYDLRLSFGSRSAPATFDRFEDVIRWVAWKAAKTALRAAGLNEDGFALFHFLDDLLAVSANAEIGAIVDAAITDWLESINFPIKQGPGKRYINESAAEWLGLVLCAETQTITIPEVKVRKLNTLTAPLIKGRPRHVLKTTIRSLAGLVQFVLKAVPSTRSPAA